MLTPALRNLSRAEDGFSWQAAQRKLANWVAEAADNVDAIKRIYSVASGTLYHFDEEASLVIEEDYALDNGITDLEARDILYDRDLRREGERLMGL